MSSPIVINILKKDPNATTPCYGSEFAVGMDITSCVDLIIPSKSRKLVNTGISVSWTGYDEQNYYLRVAPRSGLSVKNNIDIGAGVIDYDYRGTIYVCMINNGEEDFEVKIGMKIAQLILEKCYRPIIIETNKLTDTKRSESGFGSTGLF
jgi:dUTP pyrophosphatase